MQLANIVIKASNGTTDVVYKANTPQNGDFPALWYIADVNKPRSQWPKLATKVRPAKGNGSTHVDIVMNQPIEVVTNGIISVKYATFSGTAVISNSIPTALLKEFNNNVAKIISSQFIAHCESLEPAV